MAHPAPVRIDLPRGAPGMTFIRECPFLQGSVSGNYGIPGRSELRPVIHNRLEEVPVLLRCRPLQVGPSYTIRRSSTM
jgi:hypothetical protein